MILNQIGWRLTEELEAALARRLDCITRPDGNHRTARDDLE